MRPLTILPVLLASVITPLAYPRTAHASDTGDTIFLRAGGRVRGVVIEESPTKGVQIKLPTGEVRTIQADQVERVAYESDAVGVPAAGAPASTEEPQTAAPATTPQLAAAPTQPAAAPATTPLAPVDSSQAKQPTTPEKATPPERNFLSMGVAGSLAGYISDGAGYWAEGNFALRLNLKRWLSVEFAAGPALFASEDKERAQSDSDSEEDLARSYSGWATIVRSTINLNMGPRVMTKVGPMLGWMSITVSGDHCANATTGRILGGMIEPGLRLGAAKKVELTVPMSIFSQPSPHCAVPSFDDYGVLQNPYSVENRVAASLGVRGAFMWR